ncbi:MAG: (2Fe-2S)-binding protein [Clostridia bacterium]|nr:(2Fe-2S)-binding protein [Clostridia bacterium]
MFEYDPKKSICTCARVTYGDVAEAVEQGAKTVADLREKTRATAFCGSCTDRVAAFLTAVQAGEAKAMAMAEEPVSENEIVAPGFRQVCEDIYYVGASDRAADRFEKQYPVPRGMSFNSYLLLDRQTVLFDTVDQSVREVFLRNLETLLGQRKLDFLVIHHMEPDHAATIAEVLRRWPKCQAICTPGAKKMLSQFFGPQLAKRAQEIRDGVSMLTGKHVLSFHNAPMVHWPEVMVTYDRTSETLFSADAFGTFGALDGNLFADQVNLGDWMDDYRRYYTNIVGKYGGPVQQLLQKASGLSIKRICPLHGPIWRQDLGIILDKYQKWSTYTPEEKGVVIAYASIYGNTELACQALAGVLSDKGVRDVKLMDLSREHPSYVIAEAFRRSHLVLASVTYNGGLFPDMEHFIHQMVHHGLKGRTVALLENGSWAPVAARKMDELLTGTGNHVMGKKITLLSTLKQSQLRELDELADAIVSSMQ